MKDHEVEWVLASVSQAKNYLRRRHGYSPAQWLFGVAPRLGEGILDEEDETAERQALISLEDQWSRKNEIRKAAREAYMQLQSSESLQRISLRKTKLEDRPGYCLRMSWSRPGD